MGLRLDVCPPALLEQMGLSLPDIEAPVKDAFKGTFMPWQFERQAEKLDAIGPILTTAKKSAERVAAFAAAATQPRIVRGQVTFYAEKTLREWVLLYESGGPAALMPRARGGRGHARVLITRAWDAGIDLADDQKAKVAAELSLTARSLIANDDTSNLELIRICQKKLADLSATAGSNLGAKALARICKLNGRWAMQFAPYRLVYMANKDRKALHDRKTQRVARELHPVPMGLVYGDVHYVDLSVEDDGRDIRVRLIAWMDASSNFLWVTPVFLSKGVGFTQEDVTESVKQLCFSPHGGIPQEFYLDRGSEYKALTGAMQRLSTLAQQRFGATLAKAYHAASKGSIEGVFHIAEDIFKGIDGYIGGDRTNKKSANLGKVVAPYRKGLEALERDIQDVVAIYNDRPQRGRLNGLSPLQMLEKKIKETGFVARRPDSMAFDMMFNRPDVRTIQSGGHIVIDHNRYYGPCLDTLLKGEKVDVLIPSRKDAGRIFVRKGGKDLGWAGLMQVYASGDRQGARDQSAMEKGMMRAIRALEAQTDPSKRLFPMQVAAISKRTPDAPEPEVWSVSGLGVIDKTAQLSPAQLEAAEDAQRRAFLDEILANDAKFKREASGGNR